MRLFAFQHRDSRLLWPSYVYIHRDEDHDRDWSRFQTRRPKVFLTEWKAYDEYSKATEDFRKDFKIVSLEIEVCDVE